MKNKVLFSNAYTLLTIGSTMVLEGEKLQLGMTYVLIGVILISIEIYMSKTDKEEKED